MIFPLRAGSRLVSPDRRLGSRLISLIVTVMISLTATLRAAADEHLYISGFVSQGFLKSDHNNYLVNSEDGSAEFSQAAINFTALPMDHLRIGVQLFARDMGDEGNNNVVVDWAYGDYRWRDYLGMRAGRIKLAMGFYCLGRDFDMLRTPVLVPLHGLGEATRDFTSAFQGVNLYGNLPLGRIGDLDWDICSGTLDVPNPSSGFWQDMFVDIGNGLAGEVEEASQGEYTATLHSITDQRVTFKNPWGVSLVWNTSLTGLRVGASWFAARFETDFNANLDLPFPIFPEITMPQTYRIHTNDIIDRYIIVSTEYTRGRFELASEYLGMHFDTKTMIPGYPSAQTSRSTAGCYGQLTYRLSDLISLGSYYCIMYPDIDDKDGRKGVREGSIPNDYYAWQKDICLSSRFDLNDNWLAKIELHRYDGVSMVRVIDNPDGLDRNWMLLALKTTFHF